MKGTAAWVQSVGDFDFAYTFNTSTFSPPESVFSTNAKDGLADKVNQLLVTAKF
jgi:hypothetical protein